MMFFLNNEIHKIHEKKIGIPKGSRTPVYGMRTRCPRPLDDGNKDNFIDCTHYYKAEAAKVK